MWPEHYRNQREPSDMSTDDLVTAYGLATRLRSFELGASTETSLRLWMFTARQELTTRGQLERIREYLPVYIDPTRRSPVYGPRAALPDPLGDEKALRGVRIVPGELAR
jgi:hypothetical protein